MSRVGDDKLAEIRALARQAARCRADAQLADAQLQYTISIALAELDAIDGGLCLKCGELVGRQQSDHTCGG